MDTAANTTDERPAGITCDKYVRGEGKRCRHYLTNGGCALLEQPCVEWLKANGRKATGHRHAAVSEPQHAPAAPPRDLFGNAVPVRLTPPSKAKPAPLKPAAKPMALEPTVDIDQLRGFTTDDIAAFKALGVEVRLRSETYGELWLVPAYTGRPRQEITPEHAATLARVMSVFPGTHIVKFETTQTMSAQSASPRSAHDRPPIPKPVPIFQ